MTEANKTVVIIGGGLGGLSAAISMAQSGYKVSLYEKNGHLGGKLNRLEQDGFGFDLGPSILTMPQIFQTLFVKSGRDMADYIPTIRLKNEWRSFFPDDSIIDLYGDLTLMLQENSCLSEKDIEEYKHFLDYARRIYEVTEEGYFDKGLDSTMEIFKQHGLLESFKGFDLFSTMYDAIRKRISNQKLRDMLAYFIKYVGSSPYDAPAVLNMMIYMQHAQGVWYVPGGMHRIAQGMVKLATELGVELYTGKAVKKLIRKGPSREIIAAELNDGSRKTADYFISNMEVIPAYEKLLDEKPKFIKKLEKRFEPSSSGLILHLGVRKTYPQLSHHNFFFSNNLHEQMNKVFRDHELPDDPTIYVVNVNKTDPSQALPGHENIKILPHIPYIQDKPFTQDDYIKLRERVLTKLEKMGLTDLRQNIVTEDMWTPHDIETMYGSHRGSIYGTVSHRTKNRGFKHGKQSERYDNLYFVGGTVNPGGGMPMVTLSGQQVRDKIVQKDSAQG
ncbi:diapolycopene oxygenase [Peribacillus muralis]|uniref:4,4'-diaponeurosporene oxygenase n=1 Tax=Peribacillus muralis TaxID=264697 RepID=A0A1B3XQE1_9BACI|nr:phytoene desaturase family protein [Peribacillus muralis]AOH55429.1 diapolycopene oxygenase [Peribacillus muralis]